MVLSGRTNPPLTRPNVSPLLFLCCPHDCHFPHLYSETVGFWPMGMCFSLILAPYRESGQN